MPYGSHDAQGMLAVLVSMIHLVILIRCIHEGVNQLRPILARRLHRINNIEGKAHWCTADTVVVVTHADCMRMLNLL